MIARRATLPLWAALSLGALATPLSEAHAQGRPFTLDELVEIVRSGVIADTRIITLAGQRCIAFTANNPNLARLRGAGATEAVLTAVRGACRVLPGEPRWIHVEPPTVNVLLGEPVRLRVIALSPDSAIIDDPLTRWESSDSSIVDVRADGRLEAKSPGIAYVTAVGSNDRRSEPPATVVVSPEPLERKSTTTAILLGTIVPGGGQFYTGHGLKGGVLFASAVTTAVIGFVVTSDDVSPGTPIPPGCVGSCVYSVTFEKKRPAVIPTLIAAGGLWAYGIVDAALQARATQEARGPAPKIELFAPGRVASDGTVLVPFVRVVF